MGRTRIHVAHLHTHDWGSVLQLPIGLIADRMNPERLTPGLAVLAAIGAFFWPWMLGYRWIAYSLIFLWGGVFVGIYTVMLSIIGGRFSGTELVGVYAAMSVGWGGGALRGPSMVGFAMSASATYGLPSSIALGCALFALFMCVKRA
jgi:hypothetical protein